MEKKSHCHKDSMFHANFKDKHMYVDKKLWTDSKQRLYQEHDKAAQCTIVETITNNDFMHKSMFSTW